MSDSYQENTDLTGMHWRERLIHTTQNDFSQEELNEISAEAALDNLRSSELRTLVILLAQAHATTH